MRRQEEWPSSTESGLQVCLLWLWLSEEESRSLQLLGLPAGSAGGFAWGIARSAGEAAGNIIQHEHRMNGFGEDFEEVAFFRRFFEETLRGLLAGEEDQAA
jgi:hypothetical protein